MDRKGATLPCPTWPLEISAFWPLPQAAPAGQLSPSEPGTPAEDVGRRRSGYRVPHANRRSVGGRSPVRAVARVHQPAGMSSGCDVCARYPPGPGERARLRVQAGRSDPARRRPRGGQLHGVAGGGVVRAADGQAASGPATGVARGAVWPSGPRASVVRVRQSRVVQPVPGRRRHVRTEVFRRAGQEHRRRDGRVHQTGDVHHAKRLW